LIPSHTWQASGNPASALKAEQVGKLEQVQAGIDIAARSSAKISKHVPGVQG
jgi:hypothetical protein